MKTITVTATVVGSEQPLSAGDLARACGAEEAWVVQLVRVGIIEARGPAPAWRFDSQALRQAREARQLQQCFDVELEAAALMLDMSQEIRRLKARLRVLGEGRGG
ncbi:Chaperone modulatory protein CbpM [Pigmentiphaga humi]|uniref:Chaperone modulatory protein CbpM n=1 Tax=Pigmentiphaga humi TaxID=2478468 RepID=A0A3P4B5M6_9BURK|nr:chaperone modulator CbpM [Pigmentiphaga humi]VCU71201.1 Chaperone modulatory protein CbpM [Pigmentiphaga humi]